MESKYTLRVGKNDAGRLAVMNEVCNGPSMRFLTDNETLQPGFRVLEAGCGEGQMAALIAGAVMPGGTVDAIDSSGEQLALAEAYLKKKKINNVRLVNLSVLEITGRLAGEYDLIYSRFLLEHLSDPAVVLKMFRKLLKPGGRVVSEVSDMTTLFCSPRSEIFDTWLKCQSPPVLRFNVESGRDVHLRHYEAGFKNVAAAIHHPLLQTPRQKSYMAIVFAEYREKMLGDGNVFPTPKEADAFARGLDSFIKDKRFIASFPRITQVCARL